MIDNLYMQCCHSSGENLPVLIVVHGWDGQGVYDYLSLRQLAQHGFFVVSVGMRGRNAALGTRDASGLEIHDIYDAVQYARAQYAGVASADRAVLVGFSGGGGNAFAAACKFPDTFQSIIAFYGMSDYGRHPTYGWYYNNSYAKYETDMEAAIGGSPVAVPDAYYARDATAAITNYAGKLIVFHDQGDGVVPVVHSERIIAALDAASMTNYDANYSNAGSAVRWSHGLNIVSSAMQAAEAIYVPLAQNAPAWTIPASGTITVIGYIVTKRFSIWLNNGLDAVASVIYDTTTDTYTVTPLAGTPNVTIAQGTKSAYQAAVSEETIMVVT